MVLLLDVLLLVLALFIPGSVTLQSVQYVLTVREDKFRPGFPQRLNNEIDEPDLQQYHTI